MPLWDAAFSRPSQFEVCSDEEFIQGLRMTLQTYKPDWDYLLQSEDRSEVDNTMINFQLSIKQEIMDKMEDMDRVFRGNMLGWSDRSNCQTILIPHNDKIASIIAEGDNYFLKKLTVHLASGEHHVFGD